MGLKMIDMLSVGPVLGIGFGFWIHKRYERKEQERLRQPKSTPSSTGDKELDALFGLTVAPLPLSKAVVQS